MLLLFCIYTFMINQILYEFYKNHYPPLKNTILNRGIKYSNLPDGSQDRLNYYEKTKGLYTYRPFATTVIIL